MTGNTSVSSRQNQAKGISFPLEGDPSFWVAFREPPERIRKLMKRFRGASRPCIHVLTGRFEGPRLCTRGYQCDHCGFDQMLDEIGRTQEG